MQYHTFKSSCGLKHSNFHELDIIIQQELVDMSSLKLMPSKFSQQPQTFTKPAQKRYFHGQECLARRDEDHHVSKLVMLKGEYIFLHLIQGPLFIAI